jgi:hypothetical protein
MSERRLHVTFGDSAAGSLKSALARTSFTEEVVPLVDDYSMGPLEPGDADQRAEWERVEVSDVGVDVIATSESVTSFWDKVSTWPGTLIVWLSSESLRELCGLHALLWRLPDANIHIIDIAHDVSGSFGSVGDTRIIELGLLERATPISDISRASWRAEWRRLRQDNAPLRVLRDKRLVSVPIDHFDDRIRARITDSWRSCARIVGEVTAVDFHSDLFIFGRLLHLVDADELEGECDDELWSMSGGRVRRRPR